MNDNYLQIIYNFAFSTYNKLLFYNIFYYFMSSKELSLII